MSSWADTVDDEDAPACAPAVAPAAAPAQPWVAPTAVPAQPPAAGKGSFGFSNTDMKTTSNFSFGKGAGAGGAAPATTTTTTTAAAAPSPVAAATTVKNAPAPAAATATTNATATAAGKAGGGAAAAAAGAKSKNEDEDDDPDIDNEHPFARLKIADGIVDIKILQADPSSVLYSARSFEELSHLPSTAPIPPSVMKGIADLGYVQPSKIQESALPLLLKNPPPSPSNPLGKPENMIFQSQAGTGKTAAFAITILSRVDPSKKYPQAIVVSPTFNLCMQTKSVIEKMAKHTGLEVFVVFGGTGPDGERPVLPDHYTQQILVCTPGAIKNEVMSVGARRRMDPSHIKVLVLDEADELVTKDFLGDAQKTISKMPPAVQTILLSATFDGALLDTARRLVATPVNIITLPKSEICLDNVKQMYCECHNKFAVLAEIVSLVQFDKMLIFVDRRTTATELGAQLLKAGFSVGVLHGDWAKHQQHDILQRFRDRKDKILVTTNILARGIDVERVSLVVHYDLPMAVGYNGRTPDPSTYIHRTGRTGRFGQKGVSLALVTNPHEKEVLHRISEVTTIPIQRLNLTAAEIAENVGTYSK